MADVTWSTLTPSPGAAPALPIPVWVLLGFAAWTLLSLMLSVGVYRLSRILTRRAEIKEFRGDRLEGPDWYKRAMRNHANCVENLPVYGAIVLAMVVGGVQSSVLDVLAVVLLCARVVHTVIFVGFEQTNLVTALRFTFFFVQFVCMFGMGGVVTAGVVD